MKSYFGGLLCVCWSPDSKYIMMGGEYDLVTMWLLHERQVVCQGHGSTWLRLISTPRVFVITKCWILAIATMISITHHTNAGLPHEALWTSTRSSTSKGSSRSIDSKGLNMIMSYLFG